MIAEQIAAGFLLGLGCYLALGLVFAPIFLVVGIQRIDPAAVKGTRGFRLLVLPGVIAFWPYLAFRWSKGAVKPPCEHSPHRDAAPGGCGSCAVCPKGAEHQ